MRPAAVPLAGLVVTVAIAIAVRDRTTSIVDLGLLSAGVALLTGAVGAWVGRALRRASLGVQVTVVVLTAVAAVALGVWAAARTMIVDRAALSSLAVILAAAATGAGTTATFVTRRLRRESGSLVALTRTLAADEAPDDAALPATAELRTVGRALVSAGAELRDGRERERSLEEARRELVAWMSHDLRTPLASVRAMVSALEDQVATDHATVARYHRTIRQEVDHLAQLIDDLFELNRAHARPTSAPRDTVALSDLASDTLASMRPLADAAAVELAGHAVDEPLVDVVARDVGRALRNVIDNAIRHTPAAGTVIVTTAVRNGCAAVDVRDGCGGIPLDALSRVFDVGFTGRAARTRDRNGDSTGAAGGGLGLSVARGLIELHGGSIAVENVPGGCCFSVQLPLAATPTPSVTS